MRPTIYSTLVLTCSALLLSGCCSARVCQPLDQPVLATASAEGTQIFMDVLTVRIPSKLVATTLGEITPTADRVAIPLSETQARQLRKTFKTHKDIRTLQAPKVLALDGQDGSVSIGESLRFAKTVAQPDAQGELDFSVQEHPIGEVKIGYELRFLASHNATSNLVSVELRESDRRLRSKFGEQKIDGVTREAFLRDEVIEERLETTFDVAADSHVLIGSPETYADKSGSYRRVSLIRISVILPNSAQ